MKRRRGSSSVLSSVIVCAVSCFGQTPDATRAEVARGEVNEAEQAGRHPDETPLPWREHAPLSDFALTTCSRRGEPSAGTLGFDIAQLLSCVERMLAVSSLPDALDRKFVRMDSVTGPDEHSLREYEIKDYVSVVARLEGSEVTSMDVYFFNTFRKEHGFTPELAAQYAVLASVFPSAALDPLRGEALFKSIDQRGRASNRHLITSRWDGITFEASFLPVSVRYRFTPTLRSGVEAGGDASIPIDGDYGTLSFLGTVERIDEGEEYEFRVDVAVTFHPDAEINRTPVAELRWCHLVATAPREEGRPPEVLYRDVRRISVLLGEGGERKRLSGLRFRLPKSVSAKAAHVGLAVSDDRLLWPIPGELGNAANETPRESRE